MLYTIFVSITVMAQNQKVKIGVKAGLNISSLAFDENEMNSSSRTGFTAGVMVEIPLAKNFSLQPELLYSQQGGKTSFFDSEVTNSNYKGTLELNYLNIPVEAKSFLPKEFQPLHLP